jgi:regulatory protein
MHDLDAPSTDVSPVEVRRAAMNLLARREHSFNELIEKLSRRFPDRDFLSSSLRVLTEQNLQSDERFAESFINARKARGKGPVMIRHELKQKGVAIELVDTYLNDEAEQWLAIAENTYQKKFGDKPAQDQKDRAKRMRFMQSRGFSGDIIRQLMQ